MNFWKLIPLFSREWNLTQILTYRAAIYNTSYLKEAWVTKVRERGTEKERRAQPNLERQELLERHLMQERPLAQRVEIQKILKIYHSNQLLQAQTSPILSSNLFLKNKLSEI